MSADPCATHPYHLAVGHVFLDGRCSRSSAKQMPEMKLQKRFVRAEKRRNSFNLPC